VARPPHVLARRAHKIDRSGQGLMVCSPDARSLRLPGHLPYGTGGEICRVKGGRRAQRGQHRRVARWV